MHDKPAGQQPGKPAHAALAQWTVRDDCLQVAGIPLTQVAERVGRTPFYVYDRGQVRARVALLREHLPAEVELHFAVKANPMPALVGLFATLVDGLDVASAGELHVALDAGADARHVSFAGPGKTAHELRQAIASGVLVNVESLREVRLLTSLSSDLGLPARVAVRVNPDFELKSSGMKMGGGAKQFGIDAEAVAGVLSEIGRLGLKFEGFHIFGGSQNLNAHAICETQRQTFELALRLAGVAPAPVRVLNVGGGFGIPYFPGEKPLDLAAIGESLHALVTRAKRDLPHARLIVELGRYLVGEAGLYVSRVIDRKVSRGHVFLIVDGGLHHHLAASGNFGQVLRKNYPVVIGNKVRGASREIASVVGPLCTPLDLLAERMDLAVAEPGDLVAVLQSGAYGVSASPTGFLSHPRPLEVLI